MTTRCVRRAVCLAATLLAACSELEATFVPDCIAFAGETIAVAGAHFEWDRFTDVITIGPDGEPEDPFPGYPRRGIASLDGDRLVLTADDGERLPDRFLVETGGRLYLLTAEQQAAWRASSTWPACPLVADSAPD